MMPLSYLEYIPLRLARRFLFTQGLLDRLKGLAYYRPSLGETEPQSIVAQYERYLKQADYQLAGKTCLELGCGRTNASLYHLAARHAATFWAFEPHAALAAELDQRQLNTAAQQYGLSTAALQGRVRRASDLNQIEPGTIDLILSHSVLEHVNEPGALFKKLGNILGTDGCMLHLVDYRDHFFKYPYHFLTFSERTWERWLNPGDLTRQRLGAHIKELKAAGFDVSIMKTQTDRMAFERIRPYLDKAYAHGSSGFEDVTFATLFCRKRSNSPTSSSLHTREKDSE